MIFIKRNWVNCVSITSYNFPFWIFFFITMAFKAEIILMLCCWIWKIHCHNSTTAFNTPHRKPLPRSKTTNATRTMSQGTFKHMNRIKLSICNIPQIPNMNPFFTMRCNQQGKLPTHLLNRFCDPTLSNLLQLSTINWPKLDDAVPTGGYQNIPSLDLKSVYILHRCLMLTDSDRLSIHRIPSLYSIIRMSNKNRRWILTIQKLVTQAKTKTLLLLLG